MMKESRQENRQRGGGLRTFLAFAIGATVGSVVALLYAPASGQVTRKRLALKARSLQRAALRRLGQTQRELATRAERVREAAAEWITDHVPHGNGRHPIRHRTIRHAAAR